FAPIPKSDERFARQYRFGPPPEFPLASPRSGIVHHLSGPDMHAPTRTLHRRSGSAGGATPREGSRPLASLCLPGFRTRRLARMSDSLVRVSRRVGWGAHWPMPRSRVYPAGHADGARHVLDRIDALDGIYRPIGAAFPNNPTRRQRLVVRQGPSRTGLSPSPAPFRGLGRSVAEALLRLQFRQRSRPILKLG
ncbi:unnamed protein product, partial [Musa acuminata subsp. burmannicoides]